MPKGRVPTCRCGECAKCKNRAAQQRWRNKSAANRDAANQRKKRRRADPVRGPLLREAENLADRERRRQDKRTDKQIDKESGKWLRSHDKPSGV